MLVLGTADILKWIFFQEPMRIEFIQSQTLLFRLSELYHSFSHEQHLRSDIHSPQLYLRHLIESSDHTGNSSVPAFRVASGIRGGASGIVAILVFCVGILGLHVRKIGRPELNELRSDRWEAADLLFRCLNLGIFVLNIMFQPDSLIAWEFVVMFFSRLVIFFAAALFFVELKCQGSTRLQTHLHMELWSEGILSRFTYIALMLFSMLDSMLLKMLPWKRREYSKISKGFPNIFVAQMCIYSTFASSCMQFAVAVALTARVIRDKDSFIVDTIFFLLFSILSVIRASHSLYISINALIIRRNQKPIANHHVRSSPPPPPLDSVGTKKSELTVNPMGRGTPHSSTASLVSGGSGEIGGFARIKQNDEIETEDDMQVVHF